MRVPERLVTYCKEIIDRSLPYPVLFKLAFPSSRSISSGSSPSNRIPAAAIRSPMMSLRPASKLAAMLESGSGRGTSPAVILQFNQLAVFQSDLHRDQQVVSMCHTLRTTNTKDSINIVIEKYFRESR